jgi:hypothetical protein
MVQNKPQQKVMIDWLTTIAIAAVAISLTIGFHEGMHALSCIGVGGDLQELSALHALCDTSEIWQGKIVSGIASVANIVVGFVCLVVLRQTRQQSSEWQFFLWLFMLMNWLNGAGYWMFSGIANVGDWANVIAGWEPHVLWRIVMTAVGTGTFAFFVWLALKELGKIIGGSADEQIGRATKLGLLAYATAGLVILLAGVFNPYGMGSLPVIAGLLAVLGGLSPLAWMMQWFRAKSFVKLPQQPLQIQRQWSWIGAAGFVIFVYAFILGRTLYF